MTNSTVLLILGMHRSGTSALARVCNLLGMALEDTVLPANDYNETGFWEAEAVVTINSRLLSTFSARWDDMADLPEGWKDMPEAQAAVPEIKAFVESHRAERLWGIKDPRMSRLLPLWKPVFEQCGMRQVALIALRHPLEVAASLAKRDSFAPAQSLMLWLKYMLEAERHTRGLTRVVVSYPALLEDWRQEMKRIAETVNIDWPIATNAAEIDTFLAPELRHHREPAATHFPAVSNWVQEVYELFQAPTLDSKRLDAIYAEIRDHTAPYEIVWRAQRGKLSSISQLEESLRYAERQLVRMAEIQAALSEYHAAYTEIAAKHDALRLSTSWKITEPLRWLIDTMKGTRA